MFGPGFGVQGLATEDFGFAESGLGFVP